MGCRQKLLLSFMIGRLVLFDGIEVTAALTSQEIAKTTLGSTVHLGLIDAKGNSWTGSGFVIRDGQIATNHHVIDNMSIGGAKLVGQEEVYLIKAILAVDKERDLAIVKVTGLDVPPLPLGDSDAVQIGDKVYVAGNPRGLEGTFTGGMISAIRPEGIPLVRGKILQMDAAISPGSSGGPVLNERGEVIGISVGHRIGGQNLNFAIPVNYLKLLANIPITRTLVKPKQAQSKVNPPPAEPPPVESKQVTPKVDPPPVESKPVRPSAEPPPVKPKPTLTSREIAEIALGSTVHLATINAKGGSTGSGFFVAPNQIATNFHVIEAILNEGALGGVKLVGKDEIYAIEDIVSSDTEKDLAILRVKGIKTTGVDVPVLPLGDSDAVQIGDKVYVAGNPEGLEGTFSDGIISAIRGNSTDKIFQMTAPISPGSSGGPVLNNSGKVIGISVGGMEHGQNLNFAIPVNYLKVIIPTTLTPAKPKPVNPPSVESKPTKPQAEPPAEPKPVKPQDDLPPIKPKPVTPQVDPIKPEPSKPQLRPDMLEKGVKLYEQARYNEAIKVLSSIIRELEDPEQRARAYLYLGCSKRGSGEGYDKVTEHFEESIRHNPNQKLPPRVGKDHPIFAELLDEVRKELTGELTVISLLPQTEIWIFGTGTDRKMLGTGIVSSRLLRGNYIVEGIYAGESQRKTITIEPGRHEVLDLGIPPTVEHDSPSRISVGERIPLTLNLISSKAPRQVKIYYQIYDKDGNELAPNSQKMRLWNQQSESSTWTYDAGLPSQKHVGSIEYYIEIEYDNHLVFRQPRTQSRYYQIFIVDDKPPTISLLYPPEGAKFGTNQQITIRAEVTDNIAVKDVHIHASSFNSQETQKLAAEGPSDIYTIDITASNIVALWYYLTATDEEGNEGRSESRHLEIKIATNDAENENKPESVPPKIKTSTDSEGNESKLKPEKEPLEEEPLENPPPPAAAIYQGIWASVAADNASISGSDGSYMFRLAYLREGKNQSTLGVQLDFSYPDRTNMSVMFQWGPALGESDVAFTLLGGIAAYEDSPRSTHTTPIFGAGLKFYPRDKIVIDATSSIKVRSDFGATYFYHYEIGGRVYITRELNLRIGYGKLYLGNRDFTTIQVGLGYTF